MRPRKDVDSRFVFHFSLKTLSYGNEMNKRRTEGYGEHKTQ